MDSMNTEESFQIEFQPTGKRVLVAKGMTILEAARNSGIELVSVCGGEGFCGQCQVIVLEGDVNQLSSDERFVFSDLELSKGYRLACRTKPMSDLKIEIPKLSLVTAPRLQTSSNLREITVDPPAHSYEIEIPPPDLEDLRADFQRLVDELNHKYGLKNLYASPATLRQLSPALRKQGWEVAVFVHEQEIVGVVDLGQKPLGFAVDMGTTKFAATLVDMESGEDLAVKGIPNPQIGYGEDVISRLNYVHRHPDGGKMLSEIVENSLDEVLGELLEETGMQRSQVVEGCIVGNTAMVHLLLGLPIDQLVKAPYVPATSSAMLIRAKELGMKMAPGAYIYIPPNVGGFVGSDHVAMVLATELDKSDKISLGIDIGTNTEISLHIPGKPYLTSASCASGPAFEGAHISSGMRAAAGAIEKIKITPSGVETKTVDDRPAIGLCGSGIIDAVSELYLNDLINERGRFQKGNDRLQAEARNPQFVLVSSDESGTGDAITIGQEDVNEIQLAKGAIHAGIKILLEITGISPEDVQEVIIAGAFGSYIRIESALAIGLFPQMTNAVYKQVGNAAVLGAKWMLVSREARKQAEEIVSEIKYTELTTYPKFNRHFAMGMLFPERKIIAKG